MISTQWIVRLGRPVVLVLILAVMLSACGSRLRGTYTNDKIDTKYAFKYDGTVTVTILGKDVVGTYELTDDNRIKVTYGEITIYLTMNDDGSIQGPLKVRYTKE